jgi:hypothetical protein
VCLNGPSSKRWGSCRHGLGVSGYNPIFFSAMRMIKNGVIDVDKLFTIYFNMNKRSLNVTYKKASAATCSFND